MMQMFNDLIEEMLVSLIKKSRGHSVKHLKRMNDTKRRCCHSKNEAQAIFQSFDDLPVGVLFVSNKY